MTQIKFGIGTLACLVCMGLVTFTAGAETHRIGTLGATFDSGDWERATLTPDLGEDQFRLVGENVFLVFLEVFSLLEQRADYLNMLDVYLGNVEGRLQETTLEPEIGYERYDAFTRATRRIAGNVSGMALAYQIDVVSAGDGVAYLLLSWTTVSKVQDLREAIDEVVLSLRFPGDGSEWHEKIQRSAHRYVFGEWTVELSFRDSVFTAGDSVPQERYSLIADDGNLAVHLFVDELSGEADDVLTDVKETATEGEVYEELVRSDLDLESGRGRQLLMRSRGEPSHDLAIAVIDLGDDRWIDLRMVTEGPAGHREELWNQLVGSLRAETEAPVDAFPRVESTAAADEETFLTASARQLLESSRFLAVSPWSRGAEVLADGDLLVSESKRILRVPADVDSAAAEPTVIYTSEGHFSGIAVPWGSETMLVDGGKEVRWIVDGQLHPAGFRADRAASSGEGLLLARSRETRSLLGLGGLPIVGASQIVHRHRTGEERLILELPGRRVDALAFHGGRALVAAVPRSGFDEDGAPVALLMVDVDEGSSREFERWRQVDRIVAAAGGWLVSGTAPDGHRGVHYFEDGGARERLLSGGQVGLAMDERSLTFMADRCLEPVEDSGQCVYRVPLAAAREHGPGFWPMSARLLNEIATAVIERGRGAGTSLHLPRSREEIAALVALAGEVARELTGFPLPSSSGGLDALLGDLTYSPEVSADAVTVLAAVVADGLVREGAVWVPPVTPDVARPGSSGQAAENAFAVGLHPVGVVWSTLFDSEGWYQPVGQIIRQARGRTILLGTDTEALREAVGAADLQNLEDLLGDGATDQLGTILAARRQNLFLRDHVYRRLAAFGWEERLATVAGPFASADDAAAVDLVAASAGRLAGELSPPQIDALIEELRSGIERAPEEAALYLLLGAAYERSSAPDRTKYARACYQKAAAMARWGHVADAAEEALGRIEGAE